MKRNIHSIAKIACLVLFSGTLMAIDGASNPAYEGQAERAKKLMPENKARDCRGVEGANLPAGQLAYFTVPAMSEVMRLPDTYPSDGKLNGDLRIVAVSGYCYRTGVIPSSIRSPTEGCHAHSFRPQVLCRCNCSGKGTRPESRQSVVPECKRMDKLLLGCRLKLVPELHAS
jgi:hypothetical protein